MSKIVIITGGSKGIGKALATCYSDNNYKVFSLSRTINPYLRAVQQFKIDLTDTKKLKTIVNRIFETLIPEQIKTITLINNAGTLGRISNLENSDLSDIENSVKLNLTVPLQLSALFIKQPHNWTSIKKIINISSGAAVSAYEGWSVYCATKSAIDMFTKVVAKEQDNRVNAVKIWAILPGIVETDMQKKIRKTPESDFKTVERFRDLFNSGHLSKPIDVAKKILKLDVDNRLENGTIFDIRQLN
jgi:benzil reductase ((S)-benzoin forming)